MLKRTLTGLILAVILLALVYLLLPKPKLLQGISFSQAVYADNHQLLRLTLADDQQYRLFTPLQKISPQLIQASLLQEDRYFYYHPGINPLALLRAMWKTYFVHQRRYGASTLTMQLARIRFQLTTNTLTGKLKQIAYALAIERHYSKQQILQAYLNLAPYGGNVSGVGAASLIYFSRPVKQLSLPEALTLSVIPQNPTSRQPGNHANAKLQQARNRLHQHWQRTHPVGTSTQDLFALPLQTNSLNQLPFIAGHFTQQVLQHNSQTSIINTTLNLALQKILQTEIHAYTQQHKSQGMANAAAILVDTRNMAVQALVGSADFFNKVIQGQINGTHIQRSPGSTLKPFIYALAIQQGLITPMTILKDTPQNFSHYNPENFDSHFMGPLSAQNALIMSRNIPAVSLLQQLTHPNLYELLQQSGVRKLKSESYYGLSLALGSSEISLQKLTALYAMLANHGQFQPLRFLLTTPTPKPKQLLSKEASFMALDMLTHNPPPAFIPIAKNVRHRLPVAWKTGTSSAYRDAWAVGVFGPYVLTVWLGYFDAHASPALIGRRAAAPLFFQIIAAIEAHKTTLTAHGLNTKSLNVKRVAVCAISGDLTTLLCPKTINTWYIPGVSPIRKDRIYREVAIDPKTHLRSCHINNKTVFKVYEFWPSDLLRLFRLAGIPRQQPPAYNKNCHFNQLASQGITPTINSPLKKVTYIITKSNHTIPLQAISDAGVHTLYWFANQAFIGSSASNHTLLWTAPRPGQFIIRVVDDHGRSDRRKVTLLNSKQK